MELKIEKGVPIPRQRGGWGISGLLRVMEVGDSVFVPGNTAKRVGQLARHARPSKFTSRTIEGGVRIWRIE